MPGIRHDYSHSFKVHTYKFHLESVNGLKDYGYFPSPDTEIIACATIFGVPCSGCKAADGNGASNDITGFAVWPPISSTVEMVVTKGLEIPGQFTLVDQVGRIWKEQVVLPGSDHFEFSTTDIPSGIYFTRLISGNETRQAKFVVQH
jgi:hypothetical protein